MTRIAIGMLCYSRPVHTALTIAFALHNKSELTDFYAFYGIHKQQPPPNVTLDNMLKDLHKNCGFTYFYMGDDKPRNVQGNVDTLMLTLNGLPGYACFAKIDDDVLIGRQSDVTMANILVSMEPENVYMLMGQAVPEHMRRTNPFSWEAHVNGYRVIQRAQRACPMETYTFVSAKCLQFLRDHGMSVSCENARGTYGPLTRKIVNAGGRVCLVLTPAINMQHIGLTTTIESGSPTRSWAPARSWEPMDKVIDVQGFDFPQWEASHKTNTQKEFAIATINGLIPTMPAVHMPSIEILLSHLGRMENTVAPAPGFLDKQQPKSPILPAPVNRISPGMALRTLPDGRVVRTPGRVHKVVVRTNP